MTSAYRRAVTLADGRIDPSWYQGKGAFGGLLAAMLLEKMREAVGDAAREPRSLTVHFCAPATAGPVALDAEIVRAGRRVTHAAARVRRDETVFTMASASFCAPRPAEGAAYVHATMPDVAPADGVASLPADLPGVPTFFQHVDARFVGPVMPFSGSETPRVAAWVRLREPEPIDADVVAFLLDALPPAVAATFTTPRPVASVDFTVHFFERPCDADPSAFHLVSIASRWAGGGYAEELRDLWSPRGVLLAQCRQLIALL